MRGHLRQRAKGSWTIVITLGRQTDPVTGKTRLVQKWVTVRGTRKQAEKELTTLLHRLNHGQVIEPSRLTLGEWLEEWLESVIKPSRRLRTYEAYRQVIHKHLTRALGRIRLCDLRASHLQEYYNRAELSKATLQQHHAILHGALKAAVLQDLLPRNVAALVAAKPRATRSNEDARSHCWEEEEARRFLQAAKAADAQTAALYALALDSGMRKGELCGLHWADVNWEAGTVTVSRQLVKVLPGAQPVYGPPKSGQPRTIALAAQTVALLRRHKAAQAQRRLELGTAYHDHGLIFTRPFGEPLQPQQVGQRDYAKLLQAANVRRIKFHGLRHTSATLLLKQGKPVHVVAARLGHKDPTITMTIYAHALPSMQHDAALAMEAVLHGSRVSD